MDHYCRCKDCKKQRRKGRILGARLLRYLGEGAYRVSDYVPYHRFLKGRIRKDR